MKMKDHKFTVSVYTVGTRKAAELALLSAFALRKPDGCMFHLKRKKPTPNISLREGK